MTSTSTGHSRSPRPAPRERFAGLCLIFAAVTLWVAWALMPDAATTDAAHIAEAVGAARERVWLSALIQLVASAAFAPAVLHLAGRGSGLTFAGGALLLVGAMGMAADAVYHQAAYQLTAPDVEARAVLPVLARMQTEDIRSLVPLLLAFLVGVPLLGLGLAREGRAPCWVPRVLALAFAFAFGGALAVRLLGLSRHLVVLGFFALLGAALVGVGLALLRGGRPLPGAAPLAPGLE